MIGLSLLSNYLERNLYRYLLVELYSSGIRTNFIPDNYDARIVDEVIGVSNADAIATVHELATTEGLFAGISSGAALHAAHQVALRAEYKNKIIVVLLPDGGERYLSCL